jgi:hypothetical protein
VFTLICNDGSITNFFIVFINCFIKMNKTEALIRFCVRYVMLFHNEELSCYMQKVKINYFPHYINCLIINLYLHQFPCRRI